MIIRFTIDFAILGYNI